MIALLLSSWLMSAEPTKVPYEQVYNRVVAGEKLYVAVGVKPEIGEIACDIPGAEPGIYWCFKENGKLQYRAANSQGSVSIFSIPGCAACKRLEAEIDKDKSIINSKKLIIIVDDGTHYAAYPTVVIKDSTGKVTDTLVGPTVKRLTEACK